MPSVVGCFLYCLWPCGFMRVPCLLLLLFSFDPQGKESAQCGAVPNGAKPNVLSFLLVLAYSAHIGPKRNGGAM